MDYREEQILREKKIREAEELSKVSAAAYFNKMNELQKKQEIENERQKIDNERIKLENERERLERLDPFAVEKRKFGAGSVVVSSQEYNSILETMNLLSSKKNAEHLYKSKEQLEKGEYSTRELKLN